MTEERLELLLSAVERQHATMAELAKTSAQQAEQILLLVHSVAMLLGEDFGIPVAAEEEEPLRLDLDGNPY